MKNLIRAEASKSAAAAVPTRPIEDADTEAHLALWSSRIRLKNALERRLFSDATEVRSLLTEIAQIGADNPGLAERLNSACEPARQGEIAERIAVLCGSIPIAGSLDPEAFVKMLTYEVSATRPSRGALSAACRALIRTRRFLPPIADVLGEIAKAEETLKWRRDVINAIPQLNRSALDYLAKEPERVAALEAREAEFQRRRIARRAETKLDIRRRLEAGKSIALFETTDADLVAEVRAENR